MAALAAVGEERLGPGQQLLLPAVDQGRVDAELAGQFVDGAIPLEGRQGHLGLERCRVLLPLACHRSPFLGHQSSLAGGPVFGVHYRPACTPTHIEVWYAQQRVERLPRLRGRGKHRIDYRHIIDWLVRKPGAFADYCYRDDLFPSSRFRLVYDRLVEQQPERAAKEYLGILYLAARDSRGRRRGRPGTIAAGGRAVERGRGRAKLAAE